jgi:malic enzyme
MIDMATRIRREDESIKAATEALGNIGTVVKAKYIVERRGLKVRVMSENHKTLLGWTNSVGLQLFVEDIVRMMQKNPIAMAFAKAGRR